ncbi:MAG: sigma-70 family RNA polymerase sigma factor [Bacteroidota bacterium]
MGESKDMLKSLLEKNSSGIQEIYEVVFPPVKRFILSNSGTEEDAWDIFQKALLQVIARAKVTGYRPIESFEGYLFTSCKNLWRREVSRRKRVTKLSSEEYSIADTEVKNMAEDVIDQERWELYQHCFNRLSENCKKVLSMYFKKDAYSKIKETLAYASETVVRQRVFKCKAKLVKLIKESKSYDQLKE